MKVLHRSYQCYTTVFPIHKQHLQQPMMASRKLHLVKITDMIITVLWIGLSLDMSHFGPFMNLSCGKRGPD